MCVAHGRDIADWFRAEETRELISALAEFLKTDAPLTETDKNSDIWLHSDLAIHLAQWCDPSFAVHVSRWARRRLVNAIALLEE